MCVLAHSEDGGSQGLFLDPLKIAKTTKFRSTDSRVYGRVYGPCQNSFLSRTSFQRVSDIAALVVESGEVQCLELKEPFAANDFAQLSPKLRRSIGTTL